MADRMEDQSMEEAMRKDNLSWLVACFVFLLVGLMIGLYKAELVSRDLGALCVAHEQKLEGLLEDQSRVYVIFPGEMATMDQILLARTLLDHAIEAQIFEPSPELKAELEEAWREEQKMGEDQ